MREILKYPNPFLRKRAQEVKDIGPDVDRLAQEMIETMYAASGIGLAAPQVGESLRLIVVDIGASEGVFSPLVMVNPEIKEAEGSFVMEEGCLSIPGIRAEVERRERVLVKGYDLKGKPMEIEAQGLLAVVFQHEIDHLNGVLFIDYLSRLKRQLIERRLRKQLTG